MNYYIFSYSYVSELEMAKKKRHFSSIGFWAQSLEAAHRVFNNHADRYEQFEISITLIVSESLKTSNYIL